MNSRSINLKHPERFKGKNILFGMWVKVPQEQLVHLEVKDSASTSRSAPTTFVKDGWEWLEVEHRVDSGATELGLSIESEKPITDEMIRSPLLTIGGPNV